MHVTLSLFTDICTKSKLAPVTISRPIERDGAKIHHIKADALVRFIRFTLVPIPPAALVVEALPANSDSPSTLPVARGATGHHPTAATRKQAKEIPLLLSGVARFLGLDFLVSNVNFEASARPPNAAFTAVVVLFARVKPQRSVAHAPRTDILGNIRANAVPFPAEVDPVRAQAVVPGVAGEVAQRSVASIGEVGSLLYPDAGPSHDANLLLPRDDLRPAEPRRCRVGFVRGVAGVA
mmetsp:Transcript_3535/g.8298  ORF Transcript_3535/g.8298 Transcript_3535/m.8298 type:complete len:237 (-) Transcript_3535:1304-2014(-)